ncbi:Por secretion system C-terminal sorting domain-containing protein [Chitinophaga sp. CF118]|uniref:M43 family zinc metalloprotease n=1 Tax=Chitinophaga sp. CF118 TaxID=1884367 RepID=UPI0008DF667E|nr:M43 family zinc metalloprotease [Chitinophaga sp. CF118]SFD81638.1 Por secretion system C-terminal sorting domain-containing protein [Chitinophaga sp. CF118]
MRNFTLFILTIFYAFPVFAQRNCGTETAVLQKIQDNPALLQVRQQLETRLREATLRIKQNKALLKTTYSTITIPVVVHIVLKNPAVVTDAQILSQIDVLNKDYIAANTDISALPAAWQPLVGNSGIQFCMAQRTPDGSPTNGIERVTTTKTNFSINNAGQAVKSTTTGGADIWDSQRYLNIWVCDLANNYLGVATIPGLYSADQEGVVVDYTAFGNTGTAAAPYNKGRTAVHEIGHYFSLRHIWGDESACAQDDGIDDTPLQGDNTYGCPVFPKVDSCSKTSPGVMFNNYMDYSDDVCMLLFTSDQVDRMRVSLNDDHPGLLTSDGCVPLNLLSNDAMIQKVITPTGQICENSITPLVILKNQGLTTLTSVKISYQTDNNTEQSYNWTGSLAALKTDTVYLPDSAPGEGPNLLKAYTSQPNGIEDEDPSNDTASLAFQYYADGALPLSEGFEGTTFPPTGWEIKNYDNSYTWEVTTDAAKSGSKSIVMHNLAYDVNDEIDDIFSPQIDPTGKDSIFLFFDVAAASYSGANSNNNLLWDSLLVLTTSDCGITFDSAYKKGGPNFLTHKQAVETEYIPTASEWRKDSVNLTPIIKKGKFRVVFRNISNAENNIYLDNINLVTKNTLPYLKEHGYTVGPVPVSDQLFITFLEAPANLDYIAIYNSSGQQIAKQRGASVNSSNRFIFDLVNEPNGIYFVKLIYRNSVKTIKITKVR